MNKKIGKAFDFKIFVRLMSFAKKYRKQFLLATSSTIILAFFASFVPYLIVLAVNNFTETKDLKQLINYSTIMLIVLLVQVLLQFSFIYYANWVGQHIVKDIRTKVFDKIINFKISYFNNNAVGKLVTRTISDIETIANFFTQGVFMIVSDLLKMIVVIFVMTYVNWKLALITLSILPILLYATRVFQKGIKSTFQEVRNQVSNLNSFVQERVTGMNIIQLFNREEIEQKEFNLINKKHKEAHIKTVWYYSIFFPIAEVLSSIAIGLVVWFGAKQTLDSTNVKIGDIIGFISMAQMLFRPLRQIADKFNQLQMGIVSGERVFKIIDTESSINKEGKFCKERILGNIEFKNVKFSYVKDEEVLKGISFQMERGEKVAIVGTTGAGKSTIINLISRFYEISSGKILIDNLAIEEYDLNFLRNEIAIVHQDVFLFSDTLINNITLGNKNITEAYVIESAKKIGIHDFIMSLPKQYNYQVTERGGMLSTGQRQLISFLRAYVKNPSILILDEATSSIDSESEQLIQYATDKITKNRTSIIIAHRLATIKEANKILVMEKGKIIEKGSHSELLKKNNGFYKNLYDKQFKTK